MVSAFVLIRVPAKQSLVLIQELKAVPQVKEAAGVYGDADVVVKLEAGDMRELDKIVFQTIQMRKDVELTRTYLVIEDQHWKQ